MNKQVKIARIILFLLIAAWLIFSTANACRHMKAAQWTPEEVMDDTLQINQGRIPDEDTLTWDTCHIGTVADPAGTNKRKWRDSL